MNTAQENVIEQIAQSVFATMLNLDLVREDDPSSSDQESLLATVHIAGEWTGSVVLSLSSTIACEAAANMLQISSADVSDADRKEVASELANMVGGNLKSLLPGPSFLSLPTIVSGREFAMQVRDASLLDDVSLVCDAGALRVRLYVQVPKSAP
jgi:chemotaxis protein CheX